MKISSQGVVFIGQIKVRRNNEIVPTNTLILTFNTSSIDQSWILEYTCFAIYSEPLVMLRGSQVWTWMAKYLLW